MNSITTQMSCSYPECSNFIWVTVEQKRELKTYHYLKYGKTVDVYCSKECQEKHLKDLSEAEFLIKGTLKNHEYALIIHNADVSKRLKEKEVHLITGNRTEQRARCLKDKLISMRSREKQKYLTSNEVQEFLLKGIQCDLKAPDQEIYVTAWRTMNKCRELFPDTISISRINKRTRCLILIE